MTTPAGWYPDSNAPGSERYWDGAAWTADTRPTGPAAAPPGYAPVQAVKKKHTVRNVILGIIGLIVIISIASSAGGGSSSDTSVPAAPDGTNTTATTAATTAPKSTGGKLLMDVRGNGIKNTQKFTAASDWDMVYSFDCKSFGSEGNFEVEVMGDDNAPSLSNDGANQLAISGRDVTHNHHGGTYYLSVNSECAWHIQVKTA